MADSRVAIIEDGHVHAHIRTFIHVLLRTCTCKYRQVNRWCLKRKSTCKLCNIHVFSHCLWGKYILCEIWICSFHEQQSMQRNVMNFCSDHTLLRPASHGSHDQRGSPSWFNCYKAHLLIFCRTPQFGQLPLDAVGLWSVLAVSVWCNVFTCQQNQVTVRKSHMEEAGHTRWWKTLNVSGRCMQAEQRQSMAVVNRPQTRWMHGLCAWKCYYIYILAN